MSQEILEDKLFHIFKLKHPVKFNDRVINELKVRNRFKTGDIEPLREKTGLIEITDLIEFCSKVCDEEIKIIKLMDLEDFNNLSDLVCKILDSSTKKKKSSTRLWKWFTSSLQTLLSR